MQSKLIGLGLVGALTLSACGGGLLGDPKSPDVSGKLNGAWPADTRLTLGGVNENGIFTDGNNQTQIVDTNLTDGYTFDLPETVPQGGYAVIAYVDGSNGHPKDGQYQLGETASQDNGKTLIYSNQAATVFGQTVGAGWSLWDRNAKTVAPVSAFPNRTFSGYDLTYPAQ